jgi:ABC-type Fe3+/spermidine/putrescine transport system ATPase subunit
VAVMHAGKIQQIGAPDQLFLRPQTRVVANFLGLRNIMDGHQAKTILGDVEHDQVLLHPAFLEWPGDDLRAQVERCVFRGHFVQLTLRHASGQMMSMQIPSTKTPPQVGESITIGIRAGGIVPLRDE